jgi:hypothetical protein
MIPKYLLAFVALFYGSLRTAAQEQQATNPIVFADMLLGHTGGEAGGFTAGASLRFQQNKSLFTLRYTGTMRLHAKLASPLIPIPLFQNRSSLEEVGLLYGRRFIRNGRAMSFSAGISHSTHRKLVNTATVPQNQASAALGLPFEADIHWFKSRKERLRLYGLFPVGQPTGLGGSIGFRLTGNLSRNSFVGLGVIIGLGFHKQY